jgi:hypothetical protein
LAFDDLQRGRPELANALVAADRKLAKPDDGSLGFFMFYEAFELATPFSRYPMELITRHSSVHLIQWIRDGTRHPRIAMSDGEPNDICVLLRTVTEVANAHAIVWLFVHDPAAAQDPNNYLVDATIPDWDAEWQERFTLPHHDLDPRPTKNDDKIVAQRNDQWESWAYLAIHHADRWEPGTGRRQRALDIAQRIAMPIISCALFGADQDIPGVANIVMQYLGAAA